MNALKIVTMPKWGLSMEQGQVLAWHFAPGDVVTKGDELVDIETSKIANACEAPASGVLLRILAEVDTIVACGLPIAVIGAAETSEADIDTLLDHHWRAAEKVVAAAPVAIEPVFGEIERDGNTRRIRYLDMGSGDDTVVLLHGFGGDIDNWMFNVDALAAKFRVVAVDLPGHGGSDKDVGDGSARGLATDVGDLLAKVTSGPLHFIAHSFGALVLRHLVKRYADRVERVVAIAPADLAAVNRSYIDGFICAKRRPQVADAVSLLFANPALATRDLAENLLRYKRLDGVQAALEGVDAANFASDFPDEEAVSMWTTLGERGLVIWGSEDVVVPPIGLTALPPTVAQLTLPGAGHMPQIERAEAVNAAMTGHLSAPMKR